MSGFFDDGDEMFSSGFGSPFGGGIFDQFFGRSRSSRSRGPRKTKTTVLPFKLSLEDSFKGKKTKLLIKRKKVCSSCNGTGSKSGANTTCTQCRGKGVVLHVHRVGPGMVSQTQGICDDCRGQGTTVESHDICEECQGNQVVPDSKTVEVTFPRGACDDTNITLNGEGDHNPGMEPGDLVIKVELKPHETFKYVDGNLYMEKNVTMTEALCGVKFPVKRLDGSVFLVKISKMIRQGDVKVVAREGMPSSEKHRGNLIIKFDVDYPSPDFASIPDILALKALLGDGMRDSNEVDPSAVKVEMEEFHRPTRSYGSDDDDDGDDRQQFRGHTTQCSSQ